jgi:hypothetical protein
MNDLLDALEGTLLIKYDSPNERLAERTGVHFNRVPAAFFEKPGLQKITFEGDKGKTDLELPPEITANIFKFLQRSQELQKSGKFDCLAFACLANGMPLSETTLDDPSKMMAEVQSKFNPDFNWNLHEESLKPGATLMMGAASLDKESMQIKFDYPHWTIYLGQAPNGEHLYLSKPSAEDKDLMITNLNDLKQIYESNTVLKMDPIKPESGD